MDFTSASTSSPSPSTGALVADDTFLGFEPEVDSVNQAIKETKEQLCQALKVKQEQDMQWWMEKSWEERMSERDLVVMLVDRRLEREAANHAVVEIWKKSFIVSVSFSLS